ncbi:MAG: heavy metal translocating P-type ATPase [Pseudomonadota bacterium]
MSTTTTFRIDGMTCAACVGRVERALARQPGVTAASVNLLTRNATVTFDAPAEPQSLARALTDAGYPPAETTEVLEIEGMTCASCVGRVERALAATPGVTAATVNLATNTAHVRLTEGLADTAALVARVAAAGYGARPRPASAPVRDRSAAEIAALRRDVALAVALTVPVVVLAMGGHMVPAFHHWIMATLGERTSWLIQMAFTAAVLLGPGRRFLRIGLPALLRGAPEMNALVALGSLAAFGYSAVATLAPQALPETARAVYFEAAATIVTLILVGRWLEARAKGRAGEAIRRLVALRPATARRVVGGQTVEVPVDDLMPGDIVDLRPGERVAVDGEVIEGDGWVDESMLTGEPMPAHKSPGTPVTGGTVNGASALRFRVSRVGADTTLSRIIGSVEEAQATKLPVQAMVDRITRWFVPAVMAVALATFLIWLAVGPGLTHALVAGISVLIIACPCAMGLATPVSVLVGSGRGAELGILFRRGDALQRLASVRTVAFDKTGTLTEGRPQLTDLRPAPGFAPDEVLTLAAAAEARAEHPLGRAIVAAARERGLTLPAASGVAAVPGQGLTARVGDREVRIGNARLLDASGPDFPEAEALARQGRTPVLVAVDGRPAATLGVADPLRPASAEAVAALRELGIASAMVTGDAPATAAAVAALVGIADVHAGVLPEGKAAVVAGLGESGAVAFVGDGINDAPALAAADVGIAMGGATDVAVETAEVVLMHPDPRAVADAVVLSRATMRNIRQNLVWAFGYNVLLIPVAAGALYPVNGMLLSPMLAAGAMAFSSVFVVTNALRLRRAVSRPAARAQAAMASGGGSLAPVMKATASDMV